MHYIIQENVFREQHYDMLRESMERMRLPYTTVRIFPFVDKITKLEDIPSAMPDLTPQEALSGAYNVDDLPDFDPGTDSVFVFGAIKLARIVKKRGWSPGSMMNENHDYMVYKDHYRENLLNYDSQIFKTSDKLSWKTGELKFIRPTQDTKSFTGAVFGEKQWEEFIENQLYNYKSEIFNEDTLIQVSTVKEIYKEIRFWVVDGKIITGSQYRLGNQTIYDSYFEDEARDFAQSMVDKFQLAKAFVIDVCLTDDGWKIVECGCINCAGFYKADLQKVIAALEDLFSPQEDSFGPVIDGSRSLGY
jgi:hypothetical protein